MTSRFYYEPLRTHYSMIITYRDVDFLKNHSLKIILSAKKWTPSSLNKIKAAAHKNLRVRKISYDSF